MSAPQRTYVVVLSINPDVTSASVTGHIIEDLNGGQCMPLEGKPGWDHLLTIVDELRKLERTGGLVIAPALVDGAPRFRAGMKGALQ